VGNARSSVGTLTEIDDYLRLLFAKCGDSYCYQCGEQIKAQNVEQICQTIFELYTNQKVSFVQDAGIIKNNMEFGKWIKNNRKKVDEMIGFTKFLIHL
jgi:excinuclease UvrABC ATPase subunit